MKKITKILIAFAGLVGAAAQLPIVQRTVDTVVFPVILAHPGISAAVAALSTILSLLHNPKAATPQSQAQAAGN